MHAVEPETDALGDRRACLSMGTGGISAQTLGTILTGLVHCLEPHGFHLGILVRDGADEVVGPAALADLALVPLGALINWARVSLGS